MKKLKIFDKNLYFEALRQLRTINVVVGVIFLLQSILVPLSMFVTNRENTYAQETQIPFAAVAPLLLLVALVMPLMAEGLFSFLSRRNASDFYHALPVRRETMYITYLAAIFSSCLVLCIVPALLEYVLFLPVSYVELDMSLTGFVFVDTMVIGMLLTAAVLIARCISGTRFGVFAVICMILFLPRAYLLYIENMVEYIYPYVILDGGHHILWNHSWNLLFGIFEDIQNMRSIIYTLVLSLIYFVIAGILFVKRKSEKAESVSISKGLQLALRVLTSLTFCMLPIYYIIHIIHSDEHLTGENFVFLVIMYIIAIVIYFLYELLTTRKLRSVVKAAPGLLALAAANIALILFIHLYGGYQARLCPSAQDVTAVRFMYDNGFYGSGMLFENSYEQYYNDLLNDIEFQNDEISEIIVDQLEETQRRNTPYWEGDAVDVAIRYNGKTIYRRIAVDDVEKLRNIVIEDERFFRFSDIFPQDESEIYDMRIYDTSSDPMGITEAESFKIYSQAVKELALLDNTRQYNLIIHNNRMPSLYISFMQEDSSYMLRLTIDQKTMPKTWELMQALLKDRGNDRLE